MKHWFKCRVDLHNIAAKIVLAIDSPNFYATLPVIEDFYIFGGLLPLLTAHLHRRFNDVHKRRFPFFSLFIVKNHYDKSAKNKSVLQLSLSGMQSWD